MDTGIALPLALPLSIGHTDVMSLGPIPACVPLLALLAFCLGACPFSLWLGRSYLGRDIRDYGDGNPGATNVFRAGGRLLGSCAVALDMAKGIPFAALAHHTYELPERTVLVIGMCAILGSAFSPIQRFRGGKSVAVTGGVLLAIPNRDIFVLALLLLVVGFLLMDRAAWIVVFSTTDTLGYLLVIARSAAQISFMVGVIVLLAYKHLGELRGGPGVSNKPARWIRSTGGKV